MTEEWLDVEGYEGLYQVSNLGRVKSLRDVSERILKQTGNTGYRMVVFCVRGIRKTFKVHRLVAKAFVDNPNGYPCVNHIDEDKDNNRSENLEWCTTAQNNKYGTRTERSSRKQSKPIIMIDENDNETKFYGISQCSRVMGFGVGNIWSALNGKMQHCGGYRFKYDKEKV